MEPLSLRMVSVRSKVGDVEGNVSRLVGLSREAASEGVDMVCFPELSVTGYSMPASADHVMSDGDERLDPIIEASEDIAICFGYVDQGRHIVQAIAEGGRIVGRYSKTHLGEMESECMAHGDSLPVIRTGRANVGIQICWESHFPEITGTYALNGADMVLMPFASGLGGMRRQSSWDRCLPARAYDNTVFVACCNACGDNGLGTVFGGGACIYNVRGEAMACEVGRCSVTATLDPGQMERIRAEGYESMRDVYFLDKRRPELYGRIVTGL